VVTIQNLAINNDPASDSRTENETKNDIRMTARTTNGLSKGKTVCIIRHHDLATPSRSKVVAEGTSVQACGIGVFERSYSWINNPRGTNADAGRMG
jgi:uncharacterized Zn ribbon protein